MYGTPSMRNELVASSKSCTGPAPVVLINRKGDKRRASLVRLDVLAQQHFRRAWVRLRGNLAPGALPRASPGGATLDSQHMTRRRALTTHQAIQQPPATA